MSKIKVWIEQGVVWDLKLHAAQAFRRVLKAARQDVFVTSGREGDHQADSLHYLGLAWDMRKCGFTKRQLQKILGKFYDVVSYPWGFHIEYDPK